MKGLKEGKSFVTNGPWLEFVAGGKTLGDTIHLDRAGTVPITARARAADPLKSMELVFNGRVVARGKLSVDKRSAAIDAEVRLDAGGWLSVRAHGTAANRQAHTSPFYVDIAGKGGSSAEDAKYFLEWIDRLEAKMRERDRVPSVKMMEHVMGSLNSAREVYRRIKR